jgi:hypothetical protein
LGVVGLIALGVGLYYLGHRRAKKAAQTPPADANENNAAPWSVMAKVDDSSPPYEVHAPQVKYEMPGYMEPQEVAAHKDGYYGAPGPRYEMS